MTNSKVANRIGIFLILISVILLVGLAGSLELDTITVGEFLMIGSLYTVLGGIGLWIVQMTGFKGE